MSTVLQNSPALKLAGIVVAIVAVVGVFSALSSDDDAIVTADSKPDHIQKAKPVKADPDAQDTAAQDRARISAQMAQMLNRVDELEKLAQQVGSPVGDSSDDIEGEKISQLIEQKIQEKYGLSLPSEGSTSMWVGQSSDEVLSDYVVAEEADAEQGQGEPLPQNINFSDDAGASSGEFSVGAFTSSNDVEWVMPADAKEDGLFESFSKEKERINFGESKEEKEKDKFVQYATIDKEAILYDAVVLTELVGVTPYSGKVTSPYYFKIELGRENLMTSGIHLPHIAQMRMSGYAVGEWTTSCVQGVITSATFVFEDGTISSVGATESEAQGGGIGYLTDPYGSPCIKGRKYSDLMEYAAVAGGLAGLASIGEGCANAQFDVSETANGLQQAFTGNSGELAVGEGLSGASNATAEVIAKRYENMPDLVIAPPGQYVVVQLTQQLEINYDPEGRKILNDNFESDLAEYYERKAINGD